MGDQDRPTTTRGGNNSAARPSGRVPTRRPNRAQVKAMEARTAVGPVAERIPTTAVRVPTAAPTPDQDVVGETAGVPASRVRSRSRSRVASRPAALTRAEEYRFIRSDLRRLLITAGGLAVLMLVLLLVLDV